jgi:hypothetical protein
VIFASPIYVSAESTDDELELKRVELQTALDRLVADGEAWRDSA